MVFTLHRYIFREAFRVFVLTTIALTLILSLGSILRPVQEYGVGPRQVVHLMGYFLPITLTFVLPIAALFAASMVYGRLAADNELDACRASGINLPTLVYPGLALAIMVAIANLILSFHVVPAFVHRAEKALKADAKQILFRNIQRRGYYRLPGSEYLIYADQANSKNDTLLGVIVTELKGYEVKKIITAESANVHFNPHGRFNNVQIMAYNVYQMGAEDETGFSAERLPITAQFGSLLDDDIKFKKIDEIKRIRDVDPMLFHPIEKLARETYAQLTTDLLAQDIAAGIAGDANSLYKLHSGREFVGFNAGRCLAQDEKKVELAGGVLAIEYDSNGRRPLRTLRCTKALLHIEGDEFAPTLTMEFYNPKWRRADSSEGMAQRVIIRGLVLPQGVTDKFKTNDVLETISPAAVRDALQGPPGARLKGLQNRLHRKILATLAEIKSEVHSRLAFGVGCIPLIIIGIGLGIIKKGGHLLSAFGISAVPAAVLIVCIMMGKNITNNPNAHAGSGITLIWAGLGFLAVLAGIIYRKLLKN